jgi:hypothetical protein
VAERARCSNRTHMPLTVRGLPGRSRGNSHSVARNARSRQLGVALIFATLFGIALNHSSTLSSPPVLGTIVAVMLASMWIPGIGFTRLENPTSVLCGAIVYTLVGLVVTLFAAMQQDWRVIPAAVFDLLAAALWARTILYRRRRET